MPERTKHFGPAEENGVALIAVLLVIAIFAVLVSALLFRGYIDRVVAVNEQDHLKALDFAEAGMAWVQRSAKNADSFTELLLGPDAVSATDDYLPGLRDLSLTSSSQFDNSNQGRKSAIVTRDFGDGNKSYELVRLDDGTNTRAHVYVRVDDNWDDDPDDPSANDPLTDTDVRIQATVIAEYPVFVGANGVEVPNTKAERGRAQRRLIAELGNFRSLGALFTDGDYDQTNNPKICGDCGSAHANGDARTTARID